MISDVAECMSLMQRGGYQSSWEIVEPSLENLAWGIREQEAQKKVKGSGGNTKMCGLHSLQLVPEEEKISEI